MNVLWLMSEPHVTSWTGEVQVLHDLICPLVTILLGIHQEHSCPIHLRTITKLELNKIEEIAATTVEMTQPVLGSLCSRVHQCIQKVGGHPSDRGFKK